jgi:hypothetical protein
MFVVTPHSATPPLDLSLDCPPVRVRSYELDDDAGILRGRHLYEYDLVWTDFPPDLGTVVTDCLVFALSQGADIGWFGFEGSFDFEYLLHPDTANQVYAVAAGESVRLALEDDYRASEDWQHLLAGLRDHVLR